MDRLAALQALLALAAVLSCAALASACGFQGQGCASAASGQAGPAGRRERRDIVFPGEHVHDVHDFDPITRYLTPQQIDQLNNLDSLDDVVRSFPNGSYDVEPPIVSARILPQLSSRKGGGPAGEARSEYPTRSRAMNRKILIGHRAGTHQRLSSDNTAVKQPVAAKCRPTLQPVALKKPDDLSIMYWPYCIQLERCGGCCINDRQQSCQPTKTEMVTYRITKFIINGMIKNGTDLLHLERHVECKCRCIVKAEDCNALQEYSPNECRCNCGNADEKRKCLSEPNKLWDYNDCKCRCREYPAEGCTTGLYFDPNTCTCTAIPDARRRYTDNTYKLETRRRRWQNKTSNAFTLQ
ncbi:uncharacterized protein LOC117650999 isoform X2 [Thrips palmi]|uniref:Uncharacterized protein LOC117650999 isoform X2 n=1 Tax=Thrips palmi TaxID=161013 RepID=A0A6P9A0X5_THRPL|nr:uncharacterized protein LOC117650999 isoform X2 [Thrips palmi]